MAFLLLLGILAVILVIVKLAAVALADAKARRQRLFHEWQVGAQSVGLHVQRFSDSELRARGMIQEVPVNATLTVEVEHNNQTVYRSALWANSASIPRQLQVQRDSTLRSMARFIEGDDVPIGDAHFDELIELPAVDAHICAALNYKARGQLTKLLNWGVYVQDGAVVCRSTWTQEQNRQLAPLLQSIASLARLLSVPSGELAKRLAYNVLNDPAAAVQLQNLRYLIAPETNAPHDLLQSAVEPLLSHVHAPLRLLAAQHAGAQGREALRVLANDGSVPLDMRIQAVLSLGARPELRDLDGLRSVLVDSSPPELQCAALSAVGASSDAALLDSVHHCTRSQHDSVRAAAARALGVLASPQSEPVLVALLADASADVQQCSAESLGLFGSIAAVEPLVPLAESLVRPRLRQTARGAIGRIQSRLGDAEAGRLTLSHPHDLAGALDVAHTSAGYRAGELSLSEDEDVAAAPRASSVRGSS
ncbi:MAG TPA: HEAT repeat domain-containing protein [Polyangiaceae bacterium]|nr:HEAT repeat domain-containing protein [Polyangiaceae bacterium]